MLVYWAMFAAPAFSALSGFTSGQRASRTPRVGLALLLVVFAVLIGARFEVGGDWFAYEGIVDAIRDEKLGYSISFGDPGFGLVSWISTRVGLGSFGPSMFCAIVLVYGIWRFIRTLADPWLATAAAVPYLLIVVGMGYVRQAAAIGFILVAITQFEQEKIFHFLKWMALAALFHVSSICVLPIAGMVVVRRQPWAFVPLGLLSVGLYVILLQPRMDKLYENYIVAEYDSSGAFIRLAMNAVPAVIFLALRKRFPVSHAARAFWTLVAGLCLGLVVLVVLSPATTALDRIGLYCIPIQLFVFGHLASVLAGTMQGRRLITFSTVAYYGLVLFVWLNYAANARQWVPYHFQPLG